MCVVGPIHQDELAARGIEELKDNKFFSSQELKKALFLLDAGFDTRRIQNTILSLKAHFVVAVKNTRAIGGRKVCEYFKRHKHLSWSTIRMKFGSGSKQHWRKFSVRTAMRVHLKGVGLTNVILSKAHGHARKPKYLVTSDLSLNCRQIINWYAKRWVIELWHRDMKQNYGYIDCHSRKFSAVEGHIRLSVTAYLIMFVQKKEQITMEQHLRRQDLITLRKETTRFGGLKRLKNVIDTAIEGLDPPKRSTRLILQDLAP